MAKVVLLFYEHLLNPQEKILSLQDDSSIRIGRSHSHEVVSCNNGLLPYNLFAISYDHARLCFTDGQLFLQDDSRNGTYINGYRIRKNESYPLTTGDVVQLSQETFSSKKIFYTPTFFVKLFKTDEINFHYFTSLQRSYDCPLQMYQSAPNFEFPLEVLHSCTRERFEVLQMLDRIGDINFNYKEKCLRFLASLREKSISDLLKLTLGTSESYEEEYNLQKMDHVSHYILCLSCCQNFVVKKWFIDQELKLLQVRWYFLTNDERRKVIKTYFPYYKKLEEEEREDYVNDSHGYLERPVEYYKIPFSEASELMKDRSVFIRKGYCYVPLVDVVYAVMSMFGKTMKRNLELMHKNLHRIWHDERIVSIITYIKKEIQFERFLFDDKTSSVSLADINKLAKDSFPLCMSILHYNLKKHKHLKNGGRLQYGLFLKAIGLSLDDSIKFWRYYFTKKMTLDEFLKNYQYHILHSYGAVGKMADYPPQSCKKILQAVPTFGEYHGCPFKILQEEEITTILSGNNIIDEGAKEIVELMKQGTPQLACKKYFEFCHGVKLNESPYHPNKYFEESQKVRKDMSEKCSCQKNYDW